MKILLVDDEVQILRGVTRMIECEVDEWEVEATDSGVEALEILESEPFDVIVSDMRMPELDGAQLLKTVEDRYPKMMRVCLSGQADSESVIRALRPTHHYLSKPCEPEVLIETLRRAEAFHQTITSKEILEAIGQADGSPVSAMIVQEINEELESDNCTSATLAEVVAKEPMLCAKILQLSNSAIFGFRQQIVDVDRGISVLGIEVIRALAISSMLMGDEDLDPNGSDVQAFNHCIVVGEIARQIAGFASVEGDIAKIVYSGGLLHDLGKIVLLKAFEERYESLVEQANASEVPVHLAEVEDFGASHAGVGAHLLGLWGIPDPIVEAVAGHHDF